ncbi:general substrate transporter [Mycena galopus ATCC 62051]|nr:general substrate transporter [Mycena galopus ATCC 62051]
MHESQPVELVPGCSNKEDKEATRESHESLNAAASAAGAAEGLSPTSLAAFKLYLFFAIPSMCAMVVGYDVSVMNFVNGMEPYLSYFGLDQDAGGGVGSTTALIFGMVRTSSWAFCLAVLVAGPLCDRLGRRAGMFAGGLFCVAGGVVVTVAKDVTYLKAGRLLLGVSTALLQVAAPLYGCEIAPPQVRHAFFNGMARLIGAVPPSAIAMIASIVSGAVATATGRLQTSASWRIPFSLQIIPGGLVLFFSYFIPESPRWLMSVGRKVEARLFLGRYHGNGDANAPLVILECKELEESIQLDASTKPWKVMECFASTWSDATQSFRWDYAGLFKSRSDRYRIFLILFLALCTQWSGSGLSYFLVVLLAHDHISTQNLRLVLSLVNNIVAAVGAFCGALILDKVGRRTVWFWGNVLCTTALVISAACTAKFGADANNLAGSNTAITFLFLFNFFFCATYIPLPGLYASECMSFENRANGLALYTLVSSLASVVNTYATPIALANIGWKLYCVFIAWDVFACVLIWIFAVETSGRTL